MFCLFGSFRVLVLLQGFFFQLQATTAHKTENLIFACLFASLQSICLTANDLTKKNLLHLDPEAQGIMKKLSVSLWFGQP